MHGHLSTEGEGKILGSYYAPEWFPNDAFDDGRSCLRSGESNIHEHTILQFGILH